MRIEVVLPLPLGPRKPKISPSLTCNDKSLTTCLSPKRLFRPVTSMIGAAAFTSLPRNGNVERQARAQAGGVFRRGRGFDPEHQLLAAAAAVDHRRGVFRLR